MPALQNACLDSWRRFCPEYEIIKWDESNIPHNELINYLLRKKYYAFVSDYVRLCALYEYGGIYLDTDVELIASLNPVLNNDAFLCEESPGRPTNAVAGSIKAHNFFLECKNHMLEAFMNKKIILYSPEVTTRVYNKNPTNIFVYPSSYFYPYNPYASEIKNFMVRDIKSETIGVHHYAKSWRISYYERIKRMLLK